MPFCSLLSCLLEFVKLALQQRNKPTYALLQLKIKVVSALLDVTTNRLRQAIARVLHLQQHS